MNVALQGGTKSVSPLEQRFFLKAPLHHTLICINLVDPSFKGPDRVVEWI